jgi:hypothetical protein
VTASILSGKADKSRQDRSAISAELVVSCLVYVVYE